MFLGNRECVRQDVKHAKYIRKAVDILQKQLFTSNKPFCFNSIKPIGNDGMPNKPRGGIWTSTLVDGSSDWVEWCESEDLFLEKTVVRTILIPNLKAKIFEIDSYNDLNWLMGRYGIHAQNKFYTKHSIDFELMQERWDGIHLTEEGQEETRLTRPFDLYGWDVESTLWFRPLFTVA